jgi:hypothetical protein
MRRHSLTMLLVLAVALAGCGRSAKGDGIATAGGNGASASPGTGQQVSGDPQERARQFAACMREEGVDMPDPEVDAEGKTAIRIDGGANLDKQKVEAAMEKCRPFLPDGGKPKQMSAEDLEKMRQHAQCMRENGVPDFPDPDPEGGFAIQFDKNNREAMERAMEKCRQFMPGGEVKRVQG